MYERFDGLIEFSSNQLVPFHFENGNLVMYFGGVTHTIEEACYSVIAQKQGMSMGGYILFHFPIPLQNSGMMTVVNQNGEAQSHCISMGTIRQNVDYYIENYQENSIYKQMRFSFKELDYFIPSKHACTYDIQNKTSSYSSTPIVLEKFDFQYQGKTISLSLRIYSTMILNSKASSETKSELLLEFEDTGDISLLLGLYRLIHDIFSFICNRTNHSLTSVILDGTTVKKYPIRENGNTKLGERSIPTSQNLFFIDKYKDKFEEDKAVGNMVSFDQLTPAFEGLLAMFINSKVSVLSVHSSFKSRNLLDLKQCLQVTAAFEYYQRTLLPEISSQSTLSVYEDIIELLKEYANRQTGKKKKKANNIIKAFSPEISLKDKICKVYKGYHTEWSNLHNVLDEWFSDDITELAEVANEWRNELAHEKREYEPDYRVVASIRLIEHINYCIVLREAGYSDDVIKSIITTVLAKPNTTKP